MRRLLTLILLFAPLWLWAQRPLNPSDYIYPVQEVARLYSANFGEMRPGHFHAGIDIKTDGVEGKPLVAVADGYISRIVVQAGGYGRAVYITLNNGQICHIIATNLIYTISHFKQTIQYLCYRV